MNCSQPIQEGVHMLIAPVLELIGGVLGSSRTNKQSINFSGNKQNLCALLRVEDHLVKTNLFTLAPLHGGLRYFAERWEELGYQERAWLARFLDITRSTSSDKLLSAAKKGLAKCKKNKLLWIRTRCGNQLAYIDKVLPEA